MEKRRATERAARRETNGEKKMSEKTECWCWRIRARCLADSVKVRRSALFVVRFQSISGVILCRVEI